MGGCPGAGCPIRSRFADSVSIRCSAWKNNGRGVPPGPPFSDTPGGMIRLWLPSNAPPIPASRRPHGQRTPDAVCADRGGTGLCRDACARTGAAIDTLGPPEVSSTSGLSARPSRRPRADSDLSLSTTPSAAVDNTLIETKATLARYRYLIRTYLVLTPYTNGGPRVVMAAWPRPRRP